MSRNFRAPPAPFSHFGPPFGRIRGGEVVRARTDAEVTMLLGLGCVEEAPEAPTPEPERELTEAIAEAASSDLAHIPAELARLAEDEGEDEGEDDGADDPQEPSAPSADAAPSDGARQAPPKAARKGKGGRGKGAKKDRPATPAGGTAAAVVAAPYAPPVEHVEAAPAVQSEAPTVTATAPTTAPTTAPAEVVAETSVPDTTEAPATGGQETTS